MKKELFRKSALDKLASPERLDEGIRIISVKGWVALIGFMVLILLLVIWSFFGSIPTLVHGKGIFLPYGGLKNINTPNQGEVLKLFNLPGDRVSQGQVVAKLYLENKEDEYENLQKELDISVNKLNNMIGSYDKSSIVLQNKAKDNTQSYQKRLSLKEKNLILLKEKLQTYNVLLKSGLIAKDKILSLKAEIIQQNADIEVLKNELKLVDIDLKNGLQEYTVAIDKLELEIDKLNTRIKVLQTQIARDSEVKSSVSGVITAKYTDEGDTLNAGQKLYQIQADHEEVDVVTYFSPFQGKRIEPGMQAEVMPSTVNKYKYGHIKGAVKYISEYSLSPDAMMSKLNDQSLVAIFKKETAPLEVVVTLQKNASTPSGLAWSSGRGPDINITNGTIVDCSVVTQEQAPITLLIPYLRSLAGF